MFNWFTCISSGLLWNAFRRLMKVCNNYVTFFPQFKNRVNVAYHQLNLEKHLPTAKKLRYREKLGKVGGYK